MPERLTEETATEDALLNGRVRLLQPRRGHRVGSDAVLLRSRPSAPCQRNGGRSRRRDGGGGIDDGGVRRRGGRVRRARPGPGSALPAQHRAERLDRPGARHRGRHPAHAGRSLRGPPHRRRHRRHQPAVPGARPFAAPRPIPLGPRRTNCRTRRWGDGSRSAPVSCGSRAGWLSSIGPIGWPIA